MVADVTTAAGLGDYIMWHRRLGNPNDRTLKNMIQDFSCVGLPQRLTKMVPCEDCAIAKSTCLPTIGPSMMSYDNPLALLVADLMGPFPVKAVGEYEFVLEIWDVFLTFNKTYLLKNKHESTNVIKTYIPEAERITNTKLLYWGTNGGGEYVNKVLASYFVEKGIIVQKSMPYFDE